MMNKTTVFCLMLFLSGFYESSTASGKKSSPGQLLSCYFSEDYENWEGVYANPVKDNNFDHQVKYTMKSDEVYVAKLPVYSATHLDRLLGFAENIPCSEIKRIGYTVEGRPLEIIRLGDPGAENHVLIRARSHAWEPGGNWVVEGLVKKIAENCQKETGKTCFHILPMANKDMTVRGMTRFNLNGIDLNRGWGFVADSLLCPENFFLEKYIRELVGKNKKPGFLIDFHNDDYGNLHVSKPRDGDTLYLKNMGRFFQLMNENTWFSGKMQNVFTDDPERYSIAAGLYQRYDITGCILELNGNRISNPDRIPSSEDWEQLGGKLYEVFIRYFEFSEK